MLFRSDLNIRNGLPELERLNTAFEAFATEQGLAPETTQRCLIVLDELLNNVISYAYNDDGEHEIEVKMERTGQRLTITITDDGVPFNPLSVEKPDTELSLADREVGNLGIHLVRNLVDDVSYHRRVGKNVMTVTRNLEDWDAG